jgi:hypothetical protein
MNFEVQGFPDVTILKQRLPLCAKSFTDPIFKIPPGEARGIFLADNPSCSAQGHSDSNRSGQRNTSQEVEFDELVLPDGKHNPSARP